ncbi:SRPBCC family protein [Actinoplanes sp. NPDC049265]|uniref:SRPBCC family protein n=1 Tax=Actinoplanes sp. NPDC049265 TaxID=3363902 RepID=UPI00371A28E8
MSRYDAGLDASASPAQVYAVIADVPRWADWQLINSIAPAGTDDDRPDLVGTQWVVRDRGTETRLRITELVPGRRVSYIGVDEPFSRDYRATVDLTPLESGGTHIRWHATFEPRLRGTGWVLELFLGPYMRKVVERLARRAAA